MLSRSALSRSAVALAALAPALLIAGCGSSDDSATDTSTSTASAPASSSAASGACSYPSDSQGSAGIKVTAPPATPEVSGTVKATMTTSIGAIRLSLDAKEAPCTVNSFVSLAKQGYFNKTGCHRLTTAGIYVLQCGDPSGSGSGGPGYSFADELTGAKALKTDADASAQAGQTIKTYATGTLAMANAGPNTNGSQFFLVYGNSPLPPAYTVFGTIDAAGVKAIATAAKAGTDNGSDGHPKKAVDITSVAIG